MAIKATFVDVYSLEERELYVRLNNFDTLSKHAPSAARFRGFLSQDAFKNGASFVWERVVNLNVSMDEDAASPYEQAFIALKEQLNDSEDILESDLVAGSAIIDA